MKVIKERESSGVAFIWYEEEGVLESVMGQVIDEAVPYPDLQTLQDVIDAQLDEAGKTALIRLIDRLGGLACDRVDAASRLAGPLQSLLVRAIQENWPLNRLEQEVGTLAVEYRKRHGTPELTVSDGEGA